MSNNDNIISGSGVINWVLPDNSYTKLMSLVFDQKLCKSDVNSIWLEALQE